MPATTTATTSIGIVFVTVSSREKLDAVRSQLQSSQAQAVLEKSELRSALDSAEDKLRQLAGMEQQLGSIITDAAAAGADVQPFTDVLQAAALGSKGRVAQVQWA
jgi:flagellar biosynthesis chaperone FliJ